MTTVTSKSLCASKNNVKNKTNISNLVVQTCSTFFPPFSNYTQRVTHSLCLRLSESNDTRSSVRQRHLVAPGGTRWGNRWLQSIRIKKGGTTQSSPIRVKAIYQVVGKFWSWPFSQLEKRRIWVFKEMRGHCTGSSSCSGPEGRSLNRHGSPRLCAIFLISMTKKPRHISHLTSRYHYYQSSTWATLSKLGCRSPLSSPLRNGYIWQRNEMFAKSAASVQSLAAGSQNLFTSIKTIDDHAALINQASGRWKSSESKFGRNYCAKLAFHLRRIQEKFAIHRTTKIHAKRSIFTTLTMKSSAEIFQSFASRSWR